MVDHINNGEEGFSVREKLNTVIDRTNTLNGIENQVESNKNLSQQNKARIDQEIQDRIDGDNALQADIDGKADKEHGHEIADIDGLQDDLDGKQPAGDYVEEAPEDGFQYGRQLRDGAMTWTVNEGGAGGGGAGAGMVISAEPPASEDRVPGLQWMDENTGEIWIWDGVRFLEFPASGQIGPQGEKGNPGDKGDKGDKGDPGEGSEFVEEDPTVPDHVKGITQDDIDGWNAGGSGGSGSSVHIGDTPPENPEEGQLWQSSASGDEGLYCWDGLVWFEVAGANGADGAGGNIQDGAADGSQDGIIATWDSASDQWRANTAVTVDASGNTAFGGNLSIDRPSVNGANVSYVASTGSFQTGVNSAGDFFIYDSGNSAERFNIKQNGDATFGGDIRVGRVVLGNTWQEGSLGFSNANWGMLFRSPNVPSDFYYGFQANDGANLLTLDTSGDATFSGTVQSAGSVNTGNWGIWRSSLDHCGLGFSCVGQIPHVAPLGADGNPVDAKVNLGNPNGQNFDNGYFIGIVNSGEVAVTGVNPSPIRIEGNRSDTSQMRIRNNVQGYAMHIRVNDAGTMEWVDNPYTTVVSSITQSGTFRTNRLVQDGSPVIDAKGLINTLSTLRNATMDETQDIRASLRSAIDELVAGLEHEIATMPAPEPEVSTMEEAE